MKKWFVVLPMAVFVAACGSSSTSSTSTTSTTAPGANTTTTIQAPPSEPLRIEVTVGEDSGDGRIELVDRGASVSITLVNPDASDEYHLHGYDIVSKLMEPGVPATLTFTADEAGTFELESHVTGDVLLILEVS